MHALTIKTSDSMAPRPWESVPLITASPVHVAMTAQMVSAHAAAVRQLLVANRTKQKPTIVEKAMTCAQAPLSISCTTQHSRTKSDQLGASWHRQVG